MRATGFAATVLVVAFSIGLRGGDETTVKRTPEMAASVPTSAHGSSTERRQVGEEVMAKVRTWLGAFHTASGDEQRSRAAKELDKALDELEEDPALAPSKAWVYDRKSTDGRINEFSPLVKTKADQARVEVVKHYQTTRLWIKLARSHAVPYGTKWITDFVAVGD